MIDMDMPVPRFKLWTDEERAALRAMCSRRAATGAVSHPEHSQAHAPDGALDGCAMEQASPADASASGVLLLVNICA